MTEPSSPALIAIWRAGQDSALRTISTPVFWSSFLVRSPLRCSEARSRATPPMFGRDGTRKMGAGRISGNYSFPISNFSAGRRAFRSQKFPLGNFATRDLALEAAGTVPLMRDRLRENDTAKAGFMLVFDEQMFDADAAKWWTDLAQHGPRRIREAGRRPGQVRKGRWPCSARSLRRAPGHRSRRPRTDGVGTALARSS